MTLTRYCAMCFAVGALAGVLSHVVAQEVRRNETPSARPPSSNTVVLHSDKAITLSRQDIRLTELAACLSEQTGRRFTLDKRFEQAKGVYSFQLRAAPLARVLDAVAYMVRGVWERRGLDYHFRPMTTDELASNAAIVDSLGKRLYAYLRQVDPQGDGLTSAQSRSLAYLRMKEWRGLDDLGDVAWDDAARWSLVAGSGGARVTYRSGKPGEPAVTRGVGMSRKVIRTIGEGERL